MRDKPDGGIMQFYLSRSREFKLISWMHLLQTQTLFHHFQCLAFSYRFIFRDSLFCLYFERFIWIIELMHSDFLKCRLLRKGIKKAKSNASFIKCTCSQWLLHKQNENDATCFVNEKLILEMFFDGSPKNKFNKILNWALYVEFIYVLTFYVWCPPKKNLKKKQWSINGGCISRHSVFSRLTYG